MFPFRLFIRIIPGYGYSFFCQRGRTHRYRSSLNRALVPRLYFKMYTGDAAENYLSRMMSSSGMNDTIGSRMPMTGYADCTIIL